MHQLQLISPSLSIFCSLVRSWYLHLFLLSFNIIQWSAGTAKVIIRQVLVFFLLLTITRFGCVAEIRWFVCISESQRSLCITFSWTDSGICIHHLFVWSYFNFLYNSQWITFPTQSCQDLYSFSTNLLDSLIIRLIVWSLSPHYLHFLFSFAFT